MLTPALFALGGLLVLTDADAARKDLDAFQGTWKVVEAEADGKSAEDDSIHEVRVVFQGTTVEIAGGETGSFRAQVTLDPDHSPRHIDAILTVGQEQGRTVRGIYKIDGDRATFCWAPPDEARPEEFSTRPDSGQRLLVVERVEE